MNAAPKSISLSAHPDLLAEVTPFGAGLYHLVYKGKEMLTTGSEDVYFQKNAAYFGQTVAPVAGRTYRGKIGPYRFARNEGPNCLHSASFSTAFKDFDYEVVKKSSRTEVRFTHTQTVEGVEIITKTIYNFFADAPRFSIQIDVTTSDLFPHNQTNHAYWNLGANSLDDIDLRFDVKDRVDYGPYKHPIGYVDCLSEFDGDRLLLHRGIDHAYRLASPTVMARVGKVLMRAKTTAAAAVIYTGLPAARPCFTLEFVDYPLCDKEMLRQGTSTILTEYELEEI